MAKKLRWMAGTMYTSRRAAALLAIKKNDDVIYNFNNINYTITPAEAKELLPELFNETLKRLESVQQSLDYLKKDLTEVIEAALQS